MVKSEKGGDLEIATLFIRKVEAGRYLSVLTHRTTDTDTCVGYLDDR